MKTAAVLLMFLLPGRLLAQLPTREITGFVRDQRGEPVRGAFVEIENTRTFQVRLFITQVSGEYRFLDVDANQDYKVDALYQGHWSKARSVSRFDSHNPKVVELTVDRPLQ